MTPPFLVKPDRPSHLYSCDEDVVFTIVGQGRATIRLTLEENELLKERKVVLDPASPLILKYRLKIPGFLRCRVFTSADDAQPVAQAAVAFEPFNLRPTSPLPADFDTFWQRALAKQQALPGKISVRKLPASTDAIDLYEISAACLNNGRCYGYLGLPKRKKPVPLLTKVAWVASPAVCAEMVKSWRGRAAVLVMRWQNFPAPRTVEEDATLKKKFLQDHQAQHFYLAGIKQPARSYLLGAILGCDRLLKYAIGHPRIDPTRVVYKGFSMEGDFGIFLAGLNPGITALVCGGTNIGEPLGHLQGRPPTLLFRKYGAVLGKYFSYFDGIGLARKIKCPALLYAAFLDDASYATHQFPLYHALSGEKTMIFLTRHGHMGTPPECQQMETGWMRHHLGL